MAAVKKKQKGRQIPVSLEVVKNIVVESSLVNLLGMPVQEPDGNQGLRASTSLDFIRFVIARVGSDNKLDVFLTHATRIAMALEKAQKSLEKDSKKKVILPLRKDDYDWLIKSEESLGQRGFAFAAQRAIFKTVVENLEEDTTIEE